MGIVIGVGAVVVEDFRNASNFLFFGFYAAADDADPRQRA